MRAASIFVRSLLLGSLTSVAAAQLPEWSTLPFANKVSHFSEATIVVVQDPTQIHCFSSFTRQWAHLPVSASATYTGYDDHCIIRDGLLWYGYSTRYGVFKQLPAPQGQIYSTPAQAWFSVVANDNSAFVFSTLLGDWIRVDFNGPPQVAAGRLVAVLTDGTKTVAISAHHNTPVAITTNGAPSIDALGLWGAVRDGTGVHVFSSYRNEWATIPCSSTATVTRPQNRASWLAVRDGANATFYSAVTGTTAVATLPTTASITFQDDVALFDDANVPIVYCYSGITGSLKSKSIPRTRTITVRRYLALIEHADTVDVFSAPLGDFATSLHGTYTLQSDLSVAIAISSGTPTYAYSACTNTWVKAPALIANAPSDVTWCSAVITDPSGGLMGFSAHLGTWTSIATPPSTAKWKSHAMFVSASGTRLDTFNPRLGNWSTTTTSSPVTSVSTFDQMVLAIDGNTVWCYCLFSNHWSSRTAASTLLGSQARDELSIAFDANTLYVFAASDQLSNVAIFPYYWRVLARGGPLTYHMAGEPGDLSLMLLNVKGTSIPVPPLGTLQVDLAGAITLPIPPLPPEGIVRLGPMLIPDDAALQGVTLHAQALVVNTKTAYLTIGNQMTIY